MSEALILLLRAVNVGGTGKLPMSDLKAMCEAAGGEQVRTYIASGNVVLRSPRPGEALRSDLEARLAEATGAPIKVLMRTLAELETVLAENPFTDTDPARTLVCFLEGPPPADVCDAVRHRRDEEISPGRRELYMHYPSGIGTSKLVVPAAKTGTGRNLNTVRKLAAMAAGLAGG